MSQAAVYYTVNLALPFRTAHSAPWSSVYAPRGRRHVKSAIRCVVSVSSPASAQQLSVAADAVIAATVPDSASKREHGTYRWQTAEACSGCCHVTQQQQLSEQQTRTSWCRVKHVTDINDVSAQTRTVNLSQTPLWILLWRQHRAEVAASLATHAECIA